MQQTIQQAKRIGGSLMVRIPKDLVAVEGIREGELVKVQIERVRKDLFGIAPDLSPFTKDDRLHSRYE